MSARKFSTARDEGQEDSESESEETDEDGTVSTLSDHSAPPKPFLNYRHKMSLRFYDRMMTLYGDEHREKKHQTGLHLEMHREMVQATFTLMKRVVIGDRRWDWCREAPDVEDFRRAYNLVHDWYPQLSTVGPAFQEMWRQSKVEMLRALSRLAKKNVLRGQDKFLEFEAWVNTELAEAVLGDREEGRMSRSHHDHSDERALRVACRDNLLAMHALMSQGETRTNHNAITSFMRNMTRLIYMVLVADSFVLYESCCLGVLMQFFLDLNIQHMGLFIFHQWPTVMSAPVIVVAASLAGTNFLELTRDALNEPPFKWTIAHCIVVGETFIQLLGCHPKNWWRMNLTRVIDFFFTYLLGLLIGLGGLKFGLGCGGEETSIRQRGFGNGYMHGAVAGGLCWVLLLWALYGFCWLYNSTDLAQQRFATNNLTQVVLHVIQSYNIRPGTYSRFFLTISRHLELAEQDDVKTSEAKILQWVNRENERYQNRKGNENWKEYALKLERIDGGLHTRRHCEGSFLGVGAIVVWPLTYVIFIYVLLKFIHHIGWFEHHQQIEHRLGVLVCSGLVFGAVVVTGMFVCRLMPKMNNMTFKAHVVVFCALSMLLTGLSTVNNWAAESNLSLVVGFNESGGFYNDPYEKFGDIVNPYPVCSSLWGQPSSSVDIMDLGLLSWYAYEKDHDNFTRLVEESFAPPVEVVNVTNFSDIPRVAVVRFDDKDNSSRGTVVVAVKGTSTMTEAFADMGMYTSMVSLQIADKIAPLLHTFPTSIIAWIVGSTDLPFSKKTSQTFLNSLKEQVNQTRRRFPNHRVVLTGHSLGGGLAEVVGAQLDVPAVVFSAPGNVFLTKTLMIHKPKVYKTVISVMPDDDMVPTIDDHADMVQHIQCMNPDGTSRDFMRCHSMLGTLCELYRVCGDRFRRNFSRVCVDELHLVNAKCIGERFGEKECPR